MMLIISFVLNILNFFRFFKFFERDRPCVLGVRPLFVVFFQPADNGNRYPGERIEPKSYITPYKAQIYHTLFVGYNKRNIHHLQNRDSTPELRVAESLAYFKHIYYTRNLNPRLNG